MHNLNNIMLYTTVKGLFSMKSFQALLINSFDKNLNLSQFLCDNNKFFDMVSSGRSTIFPSYCWLKYFKDIAATVE